MLFILVGVLSSTVLSAIIPLPSFNVDVKTTTVSGLSSGGYMAVQMHVAYSATIKGAAVFAGGPYNCAQGQMNRATGECMGAFISVPSLDQSIATTNARATRGDVDPVAELANSRVYLFSGTDDGTVRPPVMNVLQRYYAHFVDTARGTLVYKNNLRAAHTYPTNLSRNRNSCTLSTSPYISFCDYDGAGESLKVLYGNLNPPVATPGGTFIQFDQTEFLGAGYSMANRGYAYIPRACAEGAACRLHIAFHGCLQATANIQEQYIRNTGTNEWADSNNIIVLYPQAISSSSRPQNPNACWDWWGYNSNPTTYDTKSGFQMRAVYNMMLRIASGHSRVPAPQNVSVANTTDTSVSLVWRDVDGVDGYTVFRDSVRVGLSKQPVYTDNGLVSGTQFSYTVKAYIGTSESPASDAVVARTTGNPPPVRAPSQLRSISATSSTIGLSWAASPDASSYHVYRDGTRVTAGVTETGFVDTGLAPSRSYTYTVTAVASGGAESPHSAPVTASTDASWQCSSFYSSNYDHVTKARATTSGGYVYAKGSSQNMGLYNTFVHTTLAETAAAYYVVGNCP